MPNFIAQFGISGDPSVTKQWRKRAGGSNLLDEPQWLPIGPSCRPKRVHHERICRRMRRGFLSYAGAGANSRSTEMFVALASIGLGGALHEVPFAHLIGEKSMR